MNLLTRLATRRPGPLGAVLLLPTWLLLGVLVVLYVVGMVVLAFLAVLVATVRLLLTAPPGLRARARRTRPGSKKPAGS